MFGHHLADSLVPVFVPLHKNRVVALQPYLIAGLLRTFLHEPLREATTAPLGTDVGSGAYNNIKSYVFTHPQEVIQRLHVQF